MFDCTMMYAGVMVHDAQKRMMNQQKKKKKKKKKSLLRGGVQQNRRHSPYYYCHQNHDNSYDNDDEEHQQQEEHNDDNDPPDNNNVDERSSLLWHNQPHNYYHPTDKALPVVLEDEELVNCDYDYYTSSTQSSGSNSSSSSGGGGGGGGGPRQHSNRHIITSQLIRYFTSVGGIFVLFATIGLFVLINKENASSSSLSYPLSTATTTTTATSTMKITSSSSGSMRTLRYNNDETYLQWENWKHQQQQQQQQQPPPPPPQQQNHHHHQDEGQFTKTSSVLLGSRQKNDPSFFLYLNNSFAYSLLLSSKRDHDEYHYEYDHEDDYDHQDEDDYDQDYYEDDEEEEEEDYDSASTMFSYSADYFLLEQGLDAQRNQAYCGVASSVAIINSFRGQVPQSELLLRTDPTYSPHPFMTQQNMFNDCTYQHVVHVNDTYDGILNPPGGLSLAQVHDLLQCHFTNTTQWTISTHYVANATMEDYTTFHEEPEEDEQEEKENKIHRHKQQIKQQLILAIKDPNQRVLINYDRAGLQIQQMGHGHFSPLGAYSPTMDAFLIVDVAKYKYPPVWVSYDKLYASMAYTTDACGQWDYPNATDHLSSSWLLAANPLHNPYHWKEYYQAIHQTIHCQTKPRGFITVQYHPSSSSSSSDPP